MLPRLIGAAVCARALAGANSTGDGSSTTGTPPISGVGSTWNGSSTTPRKVTWHPNPCDVFKCNEAGQISAQDDCEQLLEKHSRKCQHADGADPEKQKECAFMGQKLMRDCGAKPSPTTTSSNPDNAQEVSFAHRIRPALCVAIPTIAAAQQ